MLLILLGVVVVLFIAAGVIDVRARRRGVRYRGVDSKTSRNNRRGVDATEAQMRSRMRGGGFGGGASGF